MKAYRGNLFESLVQTASRDLMAETLKCPECGGMGRIMEDWEIAHKMECPNCSSKWEVHY